MDNTALILIGHGSAGFEDPAYLRLRDEVRQTCPETYLVMLHGEPSVDSVLPVLRARQISRVLLFPLFLSPASHVTRDIAAERVSLRSVFTAAGIRSEMLGHGLLASDELRAAIAALCLARAARFLEQENGAAGTP